MKYKIVVVALLFVALAGASAQMASSHGQGLMQNVPAQSSEAAVVKVNDTVLTQRDLVREMYVIFPYARVHNGFPKGQEEQIRNGALQMIVFEELIYQDAIRRKVVVSPKKIDAGIKSFKSQFKSRDEFDKYLKAECKGSEGVLRERVRRALLIDGAMKFQVELKSIPTELELKAYYKKNAAEFSHPETFELQTISVVPQPKELPLAVKKRADDVLLQTKATKSYEQFGLVAEKSSDDDFRVNMGHRKPASAEELPPPVISVAKTLNPGQVSGLIELDGAYTIVRLITRTPAGKQPYLQVKPRLTKELTDRKKQQLRTELSKKLSSSAKIQML